MGRVSTAENSGGGAGCSAGSWGGPCPARGVLPAAPQPPCPRSETCTASSRRPFLLCPARKTQSRAVPPPSHGFISSHCGRPLTLLWPHALGCSGAGTQESRKGPHPHLPGRHGGQSCDGRGHPPPPPALPTHQTQPIPEDALSPVTGYYSVAKATRPLLNPPGLRDYGSVTCLLCLMITSYCPQPEGTLKRVPSLGLNVPGCPQMHSSLVPKHPGAPTLGMAKLPSSGLCLSEPWPWVCTAS